MFGEREEEWRRFFLCFYFFLLLPFRSGREICERGSIVEKRKKKEGKGLVESFLGGKVWFVAYRDRLETGL